MNRPEHYYELMKQKLQSSLRYANEAAQMMTTDSKVFEEVFPDMKDVALKLEKAAKYVDEKVR